MVDETRQLHDWSDTRKQYQEQLLRLERRGNAPHMILNSLRIRIVELDELIASYSRHRHHPDLARRD